MNEETRRAIEAVWRIESGRIVASIARVVRDIGLAEELAQDALVAALEHWPREGVPDKPGAWLMATAKHRALDRWRHERMRERKHEQLAQDLEAREALVVPDFVDALDAARQDTVGDDLLRLIFTACHPVLSIDARVALTLKLLAGLGTDEIARAFLTRESTIAQRIVRAKRTLSSARVPFELPDRAGLVERLDAVLEVIYLIFNEGYTATSGTDWTRPELCHEALRLGRVLADLAPEEAEVQGLLALMELQASRLAARADAEGRPVLLDAQDRRRWDALLIDRGLAALGRGEALAVQPGPYVLQAAIAACHARAPSVADTDWTRIAQLYLELSAQLRSPVVTLNLAVAVGRSQGPAAGLAIVDGLRGDPAMARYPWLPSVRASFLADLGHRDEARLELARAAAMTQNLRERELLLERARRLTGDASVA